MNNLSDGINNGATEGLIEYAGAQPCTILFMKLHLYYVNGLIFPAKHRYIYLRTSMIWFTTIGGVNRTPKRNLVSENISNKFLVLWYDVIKYFMCTSDPAGHGFGNMMIIFREFSCTYFVSVVEKLQHQINMIFRGDLNA